MSYANPNGTRRKWPVSAPCPCCHTKMLITYERVPTAGGYVVLIQNTVKPCKCQIPPKDLDFLVWNAANEHAAKR